MCWSHPAGCPARAPVLFFPSGCPHCDDGSHHTVDQCRIGARTHARTYHFLTAKPRTMATPDAPTSSTPREQRRVLLLPSLPQFANWTMHHYENPSWLAPEPITDAAPLSFRYRFPLPGCLHFLAFSANCARLAKTPPFDFSFATSASVIWPQVFSRRPCASDSFSDSVSWVRVSLRCPAVLSPSFACRLRVYGSSEK